MRIAICAAIIQNGMILLVKKEQSWILPGGKPEFGETDLECLNREVREELSGTQLENLKYYRDFKGITPHKGDILRAKVYFADIQKLCKASAEISACEWVSDTTKYNLSDITSKIIDSLKREGYLHTPKRLKLTRNVLFLV